MPVASKSHASQTVLVLFAAAGLLAGCGSQTGAFSPGTADAAFTPGVTISGSAYGGAQPISRAKVYLLAANTSGYGGNGIAPSTTNASISLLNPTLTGNLPDNLGSFVLTAPATGAFNVGPDYNCTVGYTQSGTTVALPGNEQMYLYALGGDPGAGDNLFIGLLAALGPCNAPFATKLVLNEMSTVAAAYSLAGFATDATHISSSSTALAQTGLANAFANSQNLVNLATGASVPSSSINYTIIRPTTTLNLLANILASCVNSTGSNGSCSTLFANATSTGNSAGTQPTDTATAALYIAQHPGANVSNLFALQAASAVPFSPSLTSAPSSYMVAIGFQAGGSLGKPIVDADGNVWAIGSSGNYLVGVTPSGTPIKQGTGLSSSKMQGTPAIDTFGHLWVGCFGSKMAEFYITNVPSGHNPGDVLADCSYPLLNGFDPNAVAVDSNSNIWVSDTMQSNVALLYGSNAVSPNAPGGSISGPNGYGESQIQGAGSIAIDPYNHVWNAAGGLFEFNYSGSLLSSTSGFTGGGLAAPQAVAVAPNGAVWITNSPLPDDLSEFNGSNAVSPLTPGEPISPSAGYSAAGGSSQYSQATYHGLAIDSAGNVWEAYSAPPANGPSSSIGPVGLSEFSSNGSVLVKAGVYQVLPTGEYAWIAIDGSGNIWFTGDQTGSYFYQILGIAAPVVTPIAANLLPPYNAAASKP